MTNPITIRCMEERDREAVFAMMRVFYDSPAVDYTAPDDILRRDFEACIGACPLVEGFLLLYADEIAGYAITSLSYTTEYGGICVWIEDLYLKPDYRHRGIGSALLSFLEAHYPQAVRFKMETEPENVNALECYCKNGYFVSPYALLTKERPADYREK